MRYDYGHGGYGGQQGGRHPYYPVTSPAHFIQLTTIQPTITTQCITTQHIQHIQHIIATRTTTTTITSIRTHAITNIPIKRNGTLFIKYRSYFS